MNLLFLKVAGVKASAHWKTWPYLFEQDISSGNWNNTNNSGSQINLKKKGACFNVSYD